MVVAYDALQLSQVSNCANVSVNSSPFLTMFLLQRLQPLCDARFTCHFQCAVAKMMCSCPSLSVTQQERVVSKPDHECSSRQQQYLCVVAVQASVNVDDRTSLASFAAKHRQPECLQVILRKGVILNGRVSVIAAFAGTESCLRLAHEFGDRWSSTLMSFAVSATDQFSDFPSVDVKGNSHFYHVSQANTRHNHSSTLKSSNWHIHRFVD